MKKRILCFFLAAIMIFGLFAMGIPHAFAADLKTSENGISLLKELEGFVAKPYYDYGQYTVGYGTSCNYGEYKNGITKEQADKLLRDRLVKIESDINKYATSTGVKLSQQQFDALVSFT